MISAADLAVAPLFAGVGSDHLTALLRDAADIHLATNEIVVNEGDPRALFVVVSGKIEVTKAFDGIRRTIGFRVSGQVFGEVPIVLGIPFQGAFHAAEPSRVVRVEPKAFHALAAVAPEVLERLTAHARERMGGLQQFATKPSKARATIVGQKLDTACRELRNFLTRNEITFDWLTPDAADLATKWSGAAPASCDCPALLCEDGTTLVRPRLRAVAERFGLQTLPRRSEYDTVIIGGGPAGLAAAVYGASEGLRTLVIEREAPGGQAGTSSRIENYLGFPTGVSGDELARRALQQARRLGAEIMVTRDVVGIDTHTRAIWLDGDETIRARSIILATGVSWRRLAIEGFERWLGKGVYYGASRSEAPMTQGLDIHLIGAGNSAGQAALHFANHARAVTLIVRGDSLDKNMSRYLVDQLRGKANIRVALRSEVRAALGETQLDAIDILDGATGKVERHASGAVFVFIGADAETAWLPEEIARDARGYLLTGDAVQKNGRWPIDRDPYLLETSVPGVFACGDVRASMVKRVAAAVGEGSMAIAFVQQFLAHAAV
jgi:thioredoxin reductase (NADPH)